MQNLTEKQIHDFNIVINTLEEYQECCNIKVSSKEAKLTEKVLKEHLPNIIKVGGIGIYKNLGTSLYNIPKNKEVADCISPNYLLDNKYEIEYLTAGDLYCIYKDTEETNNDLQYVGNDTYLSINVKFVKFKSLSMPRLCMYIDYSYASNLEKVVYKYPHVLTSDTIDYIISYFRSLVTFNIPDLLREEHKIPPPNKIWRDILNQHEYISIKYGVELESISTFAGYVITANYDKLNTKDLPVVKLPDSSTNKDCDYLTIRTIGDIDHYWEVTKITEGKDPIVTYYSKNDVAPLLCMLPDERYTYGEGLQAKFYLYSAAPCLVISLINKDGQVERYEIDLVKETKALELVRDFSNQLITYPELMTVMFGDKADTSLKQP